MKRKKRKKSTGLARRPIRYARGKRKTLDDAILGFIRAQAAVAERDPDGFLGSVVDGIVGIGQRIESVLDHADTPGGRRRVRNAVIRRVAREVRRRV